ncbi:MAG: hypothetical protein HY828_12810 [Actinobacteria bacterium]|nr:hypothetical protein [Actinomycetota bacterium]
MTATASPSIQPWDATRPARRLVRLLRRNAVVIQGVFALLWSVRLAAAAGPWEVPVLVALFTVVMARRAFSKTVGLRARDEFRTPRGRAFLRPVTRASLWQIGASVVLPIAAGAVGLERWALPIIAVTIGLFLVAFAASLQLTSVAVIGWFATATSVLLPLAFDDSDLVAAVSGAMVVTLVASMWCCARATD